MPTIDPEQIRRLTLVVSEWLDFWGIPEAGDRVSVRTSGRFRRSLGSYRSRLGEIVIASWLLDGPDRLRREVLCHEAAHAAVHFVHGPRPRPHGPEWRDFMTKAGFEPRVRIPLSELPGSRRQILAQARLWEHRCPVCQATRLARTRVSRWRCSRCRSIGRSGELVIERVPSPVPVDA